MRSNTMSHRTTSNAMFNLERRQALDLVLLVIAAGPSIAADDTARAFELLRVGDDEPRALALIQRKRPHQAHHRARGAEGCA